jgi:hypothetical protein
LGLFERIELPSFLVLFASATEQQEEKRRRRRRRRRRRTKYGRTREVS